MTSDDVKTRLSSEPDFVYLPHFEFSLAKVMDKYPDGAPDEVIAKALMITEEEVEMLYQQIVKKLRRLMGAASSG